MRQGKKVKKWKMQKKMRKNGKGKEENEETLKNERGQEENQKFKGKKYFLLVTLRKRPKLLRSLPK